MATPHVVSQSALSQGGQPIAYVRPHDVEIFTNSGQPLGQPATVAHMAAAGPTVRVELRVDGEEKYIEADISREKLRELAIAVGQKVYVRPRDARIFFANGQHPD